MRTADRATLGAKVEGSGSPEPSGYAVRLGGQASLERLVVRTDPRQMEGVAPPPTPPGTREVRIDKPGESAGNFATVRDLMVSGKAGSVAVPPGTDGKLAANGHNALVLGVAGSTEPASYSYSAKGERTGRTAEGTTTYDYDALGNLLTVILPDGKHLEYLVDGESRRIGNAAIDLVQRAQRLDLYHRIAEVVELLDEALNP